MQYAELHCKSNFSFLEGASHASELMEQATTLGYHALAITDRSSLAGIVRAHMAAKDTGCKLVVGAELTPVDAPTVVLWVTDRSSYGRLCRLLTTGRRRAAKGECELHLSDIAVHADGLQAGIVIHTDNDEAEQALHTCHDIFADRCSLLVELLRNSDDAMRVARLQTLSQRTSVPLVAAGDVHYHVPCRQMLQDTLVAIRHGIPIEQAGHRLFPNAERHLRPLTTIRDVYDAVPHAIARTIEIADRCTFCLDELRYEYPTELAPVGMTPFAYLSSLSWQGAKQRYPEGIPDKVRQQLEHELALIEELHYEPYFLTVWDAVRFARSKNILCQGRGSAANSAVCYCLEITSVDPATSDLLFERFVSRERNEAPDIDVDFEHERREEVLQYLYEKYGRERAGIAATVVTYRSRSAIRDVGKALGLSLDRVDALAKQTDGRGNEPQLAKRCREVGIHPESRIGKLLLCLVAELLGFPRHLSQHVGGMVMTQGPLCELVPIENAAMPDRTVIQWDKDDLDELGLLKVDCLCLGMLTAIHKCFDLLKQHYNREVTLATIPPEDPSVYDMICKADTIGVFQIESRAQMSMLPRLKPRCFYDIVIEVAIVRPGPIQGNMVHPYLRRRSGDEEETYPNEEIKAVLQKTLGVPIFQEQAMKLAVVAAGFTPGEADQLRRAMAAWRRPGLIDQFRQKLLSGMQANGLPEEFAERVYQQIQGFGEYGFPESHAASFALLVYVSAWIKHHYPAVFTAGLLNSQPLGFYAPAQLVRDAREHGVEVRPVDVNFSAWDCTLEPALRLGFRMIRGLPQHVAVQIEAARKDGSFASIEEFTRRTGLSKANAERLANADAFGSLSCDRRQALWHALGQERKPRPQPLIEQTQQPDETPVTLPPMDLQQHVTEDYQTVGLSLRAHPVSFYREYLDQLGITVNAGLADVTNGRSVCVAGLVLLRQRPSTAKGITFVTLEDETGAANLVVHQRTWEQYYKIALRSPAWIVYGKVESKDSVIHVVVRRLLDFSERIHDVQTRSRDFR